MKLKHLILVAAMFAGTKSFAQVGIGTTSPVSTLDVRGSASFNTRTVTATATLTSTDHTIIYSGTATGTLTLPSASACAGREIWVKNSSAYAVTIATTSLQTIDGNSTWSIPSQYEAVLFMSNGSNWIVKQQVTPANGSADWKQGGNTQTALKNLGTTGAYDLPLITNNTERMRILSGGNVGIATTTPGSELDVKGTIRLSGSTSGYVGLKGAAAAGSTTYTLPSADGTSGQMLSTNGSGTLSWATPSTTISSVSNTSSTNTLSTTVNGVSGSGVSIINSNSLTAASGSALTSTVNGVASTLTPSAGTIASSSYLGFNSSGALVKGSIAATTNSLASSTNTMTSTVDGTASSANIINSNALTAASSALTSTINGVASTLTPSAGTIGTSTYLGFDASGNLVKGAVPASTVSNSSSTNTLTTTVNGVTATGVNIINSNALTAASSTLTSTVNGVASTLTPSAGTIGTSSYLGFDASGNLVKGSVTSTDWSLTGNSGTTAGTNYIGTSDAKDFVAKTNATERMRITSAGNVGIGATAPGQLLETMNGNVKVNNNNNTAGQIQFAEPSTSGSNITSFKAQAQSADISYVLPASQGSANAVLTNDGSGNLSWGSGGVLFAQKTSNQTLTSTATDDANFTFSLAASKTYEIRGILRVASTASSSAIRCQFVAPSGTTQFVTSFANRSAQDDVVYCTAINTYYDLSPTNSMSNTSDVMMIEGTITTGTTAGTYKITWQNTSGSSATVYSSSYIKITLVQ